MYKDALCDTIYNNLNRGDNKFKNSKLTKYLTQWETMKPEKERNEIDLYLSNDEERFPNSLSNTSQVQNKVYSIYTKYVGERSTKITHICLSISVYAAICLTYSWKNRSHEKLYHCWPIWIILGNRMKAF